MCSGTFDGRCVLCLGCGELLLELDSCLIGRLPVSIGTGSWIPLPLHGIGCASCTASLGARSADLNYRQAPRMTTKNHPAIQHTIFGSRSKMPNTPCHNNLTETGALAYTLVLAMLMAVAIFVFRTRQLMYHGKDLQTAESGPVPFDSESHQTDRIASSFVLHVRYSRSTVRRQQHAAVRATSPSIWPTVRETGTRPAISTQRRLFINAASER